MRLSVQWLCQYGFSLCLLCWVGWVYAENSVVLEVTGSFEYQLPQRQAVSTGVGAHSVAYSGVSRSSQTRQVVRDSTVEKTRLVGSHRVYLQAEQTLFYNADLPQCNLSVIEPSGRYVVAEVAKGEGACWRAGKYVAEATGWHWFRTVATVNDSAVAVPPVRLNYWLESFATKASQVHSEVLTFTQDWMAEFAYGGSCRQTLEHRMALQAHDVLSYQITDQPPNGLAYTVQLLPVDTAMVKPFRLLSQSGQSHMYSIKQTGEYRLLVSTQVRAIAMGHARPPLVPECKQFGAPHYRDDLQLVVQTTVRRPLQLQTQRMVIATPQPDSLLQPIENAAQPLHDWFDSYPIEIRTGDRLWYETDAEFMPYVRLFDAHGYQAVPVSVVNPVVSESPLLSQDALYEHSRALRCVGPQRDRYLPPAGVASVEAPGAYWLVISTPLSKGDECRFFATFPEQGVYALRVWRVPAHCSLTNAKLCGELIVEQRDRIGYGDWRMMSENSQLVGQPALLGRHSVYLREGQRVVLDMLENRNLAWVGLVSANASAKPLSYRYLIANELHQWQATAPTTGRYYVVAASKAHSQYHLRLRLHDEGSFAAGAAASSEVSVEASYGANRRPSLLLDTGMQYLGLHSSRGFIPNVPKQVVSQREREHRFAAQAGQTYDITVRWPRIPYRQYRCQQPCNKPLTIQVRRYLPQAGGGMQCDVLPLHQGDMDVSLSSAASPAASPTVLSAMSPEVPRRGWRYEVVGEHVVYRLQFTAPATASYAVHLRTSMHPDDPAYSYQITAHSNVVIPENLPSHD